MLIYPLILDEPLLSRHAKIRITLLATLNKKKFLQSIRKQANIQKKKRIKKLFFCKLQKFICVAKPAPPYIHTPLLCYPCVFFSIGKDKRHFFVEIKTFSHKMI